MIVFYATSGWSLNLTKLNIKFVEENSLFNSSFYKDYTLPFQIPLDDETSLKLGLINVENISSYKVAHEGRLFIDTTFHEASFIIEFEQNQLEGSLYFGKLKNPVLETSLRKLPFPTIKTGGLLNYAQNTITKTWPDVPCNFPMVYDDQFHNETNYSHFEGIVNQHNGSNFITNNLNGSTPENKNIMVPFPYLMEIIKFGFKSAGQDVIGEFVENKENHHLVLDSNNHLERFNSLTTGNFEFTEPTDEYYANGNLIKEYVHTFSFTAIGSYKVKAYLNLPKTISLDSFEIIQGGTDNVIVFDDVSIFKTNAKSINENLTINKEIVAGNVTVTFKLKMLDHSINVSEFNSFSYDKSEGLLNVYQSDFSLAEFLPDITFGKFLEKIKNKFNLKITPNPTYIVIDYIENNFLDLDFIDETVFEVNSKKRKFNQSKVFKLSSETETPILVDKSGLLSDDNTIREEDIIEISPGIDKMYIEERNDIFTAKRNENSELSFLIYDGLKDGYPVAVEKINSYSFSLQEIYNRFWKKWLYFRCNSETYIDNFTAHLLEKFEINNGKFKYNKKHLIKKISKTRISDNTYKYQVESETF